MTREQIIERIRNNMKSEGSTSTEVRVQLDPYSGWHIAVISNDFTDKTDHERRQMALDEHLNALDLTWIDLLTPAERPLAGTLSGDTDVAELPLWPEALGRGRTNQPATSIQLPSERDDDIEPPIYATFYSLRGGVGRSTALAYTGRILVKHGYKVVCVDMDLEAPGLSALFGVEQKVGDRLGVVDILLALDQDEAIDVGKHLIQISEYEDLYCLPAGQPNAEYARRLRFIDPTSWYYKESHKNPLRILMEKLAGELPFTPDAILLDSRTGITPLSGPLLFELADIAVVTFFPHPQTRTGTAALIKGLLASHTKRGFTPEPRFLVSPVPASRFPEIAERYRHRALHWIGDWLQGVLETLPGANESDVTHFVSYREDLATSDTILVDDEIHRVFSPVAEWIQRFLPAQSERRAPQTLPDIKLEILSQLRFTTGIAEFQEDFDEVFVETEQVKKAIDPQISLILGRKGTGKTAIFRRLLKERSVVVLAPGPLKGERPWLMGADGFEGVSQIIRDLGGTWRQFWLFYICLTVYKDLSPMADLPPPADLPIEPDRIATDRDVVTAWERIVKKSAFGLALKDWLICIDAAISGPNKVSLLFDGLDTGFGHSSTERTRRKEAISGLLACFTAYADSLQQLLFKIVLRDDLWRQVTFDNKSHLYGRTTSLQWRNQPVFLKVVLKQAIKSDTFHNLLTTIPRVRIAREGAATIEEWTEHEVFAAWNLLVGERMRGGKAAFTKNWVWKRLADGNNDHSPRHLLQLFVYANEWEQHEYERAQYQKTIIRPRALMQSLPRVSHEALVALKEEFSDELDSLFEKLKKLARTPIDAKSLAEFSDAAQLAKEVGVLSVYETTNMNVNRYHVPEIYRYALDMTRKGQP